MLRLFRSQYTRADKEDWLRETEGLVTEAAYALCQTGDSTTATAMIETGRALLLSETMEETRHDITRLANFHPDLADRYLAVRMRLRRADETSVRNQVSRQAGRARWS
jgi:hypothetical protein